MYIPFAEGEERDDIARRFDEYKRVAHDKVLRRNVAREHWAKIEKPATTGEEKQVQKHLKKLYPVSDFNTMRRRLDPNGVLSSAHIDSLFDRPQKRPDY